MTTMTLMTAPPTLKSGSVPVNPLSTTSKTRCSRFVHPLLGVFLWPNCIVVVLPATDILPRRTVDSNMPGSRMSRTRRARLSCVRAMQNSSNATSSTDANTEERIRVKQELLNLLEQTDGTITPEGMKMIRALQKLNLHPEPSQVPELVNGCFQVVRGTVKGRAAANAGVFASIFTLARAAFGVFKPLMQEVIIKENYNHVGYAHEDEYILAFDMSIKNREGESPEFLEGYLLNKGKYNFVPDSKKITVTFLSSELRPVLGVTEEELRSWKQLFQEENPSMNERGWMSVKLPEAAGDLDHLYMDDDLRIVQGTFKNIFVLRRLPGPAIPIYQ